MKALMFFFMFILLVFKGESQVVLASCDGPCNNSDVKKEILNFQDIDEAESYLRKKCLFTNSSHYKLFCTECEKNSLQYRISPVGEQFPDVNKSKSILAGKGSNKFYSFSSLNKYFKDSMVVVDKLMLDFSPMFQGDKEKAKELFFKTKEGKVVKPEVKDNKLIFNKSQFIKGEGSYKISIVFKDKNNTERNLKDITLCFLKETEKKELKKLYTENMECCAELMKSVSTSKFLAGVMKTKYKYVDIESVETWVESF